MSLYFTTLETPVGKFSIAVNAVGAVVATAFGGREALPPVAKKMGLVADEKNTAVARKQTQAYFSGQRREFTLPLAAEGSAFQQRVWSALRAIPFGETRSYGDIAKQLRSSPRAVGRANATNPICLFVPCHRVIGADGSLTGYAYGEARKLKLLQHEGAIS